LRWNGAMRTNVPGGIRVVGVDGEGTRVAEADLAHGSHPEHALAERGWLAESPCSALGLADGSVELTYAVSPLRGAPSRDALVPRDPGIADDEEAEPYQRVAAYAVVVSERGVLLTQFTSRTAVPGTWGLPGGGLDEGEDPVDGVHREVWEETGQRVELAGLATIQSRHWVGRAPSGAVEDFHAVRIVYRATCPDPTDPVIHDVGGTTSDARWFALCELASLPMTASWRGLVALDDLAQGPA
jgi:8-oxo-dGTP pyrophosphatase MutT (NUDIX family)